MALCIAEQGKCWLVRYNVPIAGTVRWKFPDQDWNEVIANTFTTEETPPQWNPLPIADYRIDFRGINFSGQTVGSFYTVRGGFTITRRAGAYGALAPWGGLIFGDAFEITDLNGTRNRGDISAGPWTVVEYSVPPRNRVPFQIQSGSFQIIRVIRISDNQEIEPLSQCTFKAFDCFNNLKIEVSSNQCPETEVLPCKILMENTREFIITPEFRNRFIASPAALLNIPSNTNNQKCKKLILFSPFGGLFDDRLIEILEICSPPCCDTPPLLEIDCQNPCPCEKCPEGTCLACRDGDYICCYDNTGKVLQRIRFDKKCEDQEVC
jgi:hypothetical protein